MRQLPPTPSARCGVFTAREAHAVGWSATDLSRAVSRDRLVRLRRGVFAPPWHGDPRTPYRVDVDLARAGVAAGLTSPAVVVSHLASVALYRYPVWAPRPRRCVIVDDNRTRVPGHHVHRTPIRDDSRRVAGFRVTTPVRTVLDVACEFGTEAGLVVADAALARGDLDVDDLKVAVDAGAGRTGIAAARPLPALVDRRAESPLESRSRWQCVRHRLPPPEPQVLVYDLAGVFIGRVDLYWDVGVVGEVDGAAKLTDHGARTALVQRQAGLTRTGLRVVRWGAPELLGFAPTAAWIAEELAAAAADPRPRRWRAVPT